ncbi:pilus assembly protein [Brachybacterium sp. EF45031]|nr:pilus assembly protein [Brachybacterium sillae]
MHRRLIEDRGSAVVEFPLVAVVVLLIALATIQAALVLHTRNTLTDAAVHGARTAALVGNTPEDGEQRTRLLISQSLGAGYDAEVTARSSPEGRITVEVEAAVPLIGLIGPAGTLRVDGHATDEESW